MPPNGISLSLRERKKFRDLNFNRNSRLLLGGCGVDDTSYSLITEHRNL